MAYVVPNTDVYLLRDIKITPTYTDTIFFASKALQTAYFTNPAKRVATLTANSYQRHSRGWLKVGLPASTVAQANYMMFKNSSFENKWFYAFITDWEYVNNTTTLISYMIDDIQTWFFDCTLGDCFVEREHAMDDTVGANRIPEPVGSDRVMMVERWACSDMEDYSVIVQASQTNRDPSVTWETEYMHQGAFNGLDVWISDCNNYQDCSLIAQKLADMIGDGSYSDTATEQQQVVSVTMFPSRFTFDSFDEEQTDEPRPYAVVEPDPETTQGIVRSNNLNGYVPKNKKLLTAPFKQLLLTNGIGASATLDYDEFATPSGVKINPYFGIIGTFNGTGQIMCLPLNYKGIFENYEYKIVISEFPQCGYTLDSYRAWIAGGGDIKQKVQVLKGVGSGIFGLMGMAKTASDSYDKLWQQNYNARIAQTKNYSQLNQPAKNAVNTAAGVYAGRNTSFADVVEDSGIASGVGGLLSSLVNTYTDYKTTEFDSHAQPNIPVGMTAGNVMVAARKLNFRCYDVDINAVDAEIIDEFFSKFGYQTNRLKVPNISGRPQWNYVKTKDCEIAGNIPATTKAAIIDIFNNGITFWKNGDNIGDYTLNNQII